MTIIEKVKQIVKTGMKQEQVFKFFDMTNRDVIEYIALFQNFGVDQDIVWDLYEEWQEL